MMVERERYEEIVEPCGACNGTGRSDLAETDGDKCDFCVGSGLIATGIYRSAGMFGPYGYLIKPHGCAEDEWRLADDPSESTDETSVPLYALEEQQLGSGSTPSLPALPRRA